MANEMYTDPSAKAAVLGLGDNPENQQIAANILTQGIANTLNPSDAAGGAVPPQNMPPTPEGMMGYSSGDAAIDMAQDEEAAGDPGAFSNMSTEDIMNRLMQGEKDNQRDDWLQMNEDRKLPGSTMTWGQYLEGVYKDAEKETPGSGREAVGTIIDEIIKQEIIDADPNQQNVNMPQVPTLPLPGNETQMAAAAGDIAAAEAPPPMAPAAGQQGIMSAANGGVVGFNLGGMNQSAVSEEEFMNVLNAEAQNAGVTPDQMAAVTEMATNTTGGPMAANDNVMDTGIMQNVDAVEATEEDLSGIGSLTAINEKLAESGEEQVVHVSPGELIFDPSRLDEPDQRMLMAALETAGIDPAAATVGNEANILNQMTGLPAFGWFSKIFKPIKKIVKKVGKGFKKVGKFLKNNAGTILGIAGAMTGNPWLAALGSGIGSLIEGKPMGQALLSAGMSFAGTKWVGPWIGEKLSAISPTTFGQSIGQTVGGVADTLGASSTGAALSAKGVEGAALRGVQEQAMRAGTEAALSTSLTGIGANKAVEAATKSALEKAIVEAGLKGLDQAAIDATTTSLTNKIISDVGSKAVTNVLGASLPQGLSALGSTTSQMLGTTTGNVLGGAAASGLMSAAKPMVEMSLFGDPNAEAAALAAWNEIYDYVPSAQELYDFYTNQYVPNQQVDPGVIGGTPGYNVAQAAQAAQPQGIMPPLAANLLPNSLGIFNAAGGGYVSGIGGPRTDSNLARLSDGEFVMTEQAVRGAGNGSRDAGAARMLGIMQGFERSAA